LQYIAINELEDIPVAILPDDTFFKAIFLLYRLKSGQTYTNIAPNIEPRSFDPVSGDLTCVFTLESFSCQMTMNFNNHLLWTLSSDNDVTVRLIKNDNNVLTADLEKIMNDLPPTLIMPKGYIIEGGTKITPNSSIENLPSELWVKKDWSDCNIKAEAYKQKPNSKKLPVINKTIKFVEEDLDKNHDVLILDDGAHEISDLIWIQGSKHIIHYIHCKPSKTDKPGCRKSDCDIVFTQAMRSVHWVYSELMFEWINERLNSKSKIIFGTHELLDDITNNFE